MASEIEIKRLAQWIQDNVPLYFNFGDKSVSYTWSARALAEDILKYAPLPDRS